MIRKVIDYIKEDGFELRVNNEYISIINYTNIAYMEEDKISISYKDGSVLVGGKNLVVVKMLDKEMLIKGNFLKIEFRRRNE